MADRLIDLSKEGGLAINDDKAFASLGYGAEMRAELCHGIRLQLEIEAAARVGVSAHVAQFVKILIEIEAGIAAGLQLSAQLSPRMMEEVGLVASMQAYLKAYIRARLELKLTLEKLIQNVGDKSSAVELRLFRKFVDRLEIGVGVEANAQIGLTAAAELLCTGRLVEEQGKKPGFDFRVNAEAAFMFGAGVDFFAMARFNDITIFFKDAKDILLEELERKIDDNRFASKEQKALIFRIWSATLDTIIVASASGFDKKRKPFLATLEDFVYDFALDQICLTYKQLLESQTRRLADWLDLNEGISNADLNKILIWLDALEKEWDGNQTFFELLPRLSDLLRIIEKLGYAEVAVFNNILAHLYALGYLIDKRNRDKWKNLPSAVKNNFQETIGRNITEISSEADAFAYLEKSCIETFLAAGNRSDISGLGVFVDLLEARDMSVSYLLLLLASDRNEEATTVFLDVGIDLLDRLVGDLLFPAIREMIDRDWPGKSDFGDELLQSLMDDLLHGYRSIFIEMFKKVFLEEPTKENVENLTILANKFLLNILGKNAGLLVKELLLYSTENITDSINRCERQLREGSLNPMADKMQKKAEDRLRVSLPVPIPQGAFQLYRDNLQKATTEFLLDIMDVARTSMGRNTWTPARIDHISLGLQYVLFHPESNHLDFQHLAANQAALKIAELERCDFLPDISLQLLRNLLDSLQDIGWQQLKAYLLKMPLAVTTYLLKLLKILFLDSILETLKKLWEALKDLIKKLGELISKLAQQIRELAEKVAEAAVKIARAIGELVGKAAEAIGDFFNRLFNALDFSDTSWLENFLESIWGFLGGDTQQDKARKVLNRLREQAMENLRNSRLQQALENAANGNEFNGIFFRNYLDAYVINDSIRTSLGKMKFRSINAVNEAWGEASQQFHNTISDLESNARQYWSSNQIRGVRSRELEAAQLRKRNADRSAQLLTSLNKSAIRVNCPLAIDIAGNDMPIYGRYLYLDVDFGELDIRSVIRSQLSLHPDALIDHDGNLSTYEWEKEIRNTRAIENFCPIQVKIILNGKEVDLSSCAVTGNRLSGHIPTERLLHGSNDMFVLTLAPPEYAHKSFQKHIRFYCDHQNNKRPSNAVYIDPVESVINTRGDDHEDARRTDAADREIIIIKNNSDQELVMDGWKLSDAAGHQFVFKSHTWVKPGQKARIVVGEATPGFLNWKEYYNGQLTAILNNNGEFLKLEDAKGKVVSHIYTGNPRSNRQIIFISFR
ncbi:MAG TPA: lamin tail domain-containing protein [Flavitalea sp.]|nr:lamin tail domain-containing protein [Flavitalea sp.]